jgi:hypothetical protein
MFTIRNFDLSDVNTSPHSLEILYGIFQSTLNPDLTEAEFNQYLFGCHPDSFEMSFIYKDDSLAGFATSAAYPRKVDGKKVIILRSAFGLLDDYKNGRFPLQSLFFKYVRYKLKHLFTPIYIAGFMANPLMYAMICKYTLKCYPRRNQAHSPQILAFKNDLLNSMKLSGDETTPFVLKIHFQVKFKSGDIGRIDDSQNADVAYYLSINPYYRDQYGVLVLVPVTIPNMAYTLMMYLWRPVRKMLKNLLQTRTKKKWKMAHSKI